MDYWLELAFIVSTISLVGLVYSIIRILVESFSEFQLRYFQLHSAEEYKFPPRVLVDKPLAIIAKHLDDSIGGFTVYQYVTFPRVSKIVDTYLIDMIEIVPKRKKKRDSPE